MRLPLKRSPDPAPAAGPDAVQAARTRARRRMIGALVLLVAGVLGFPLLFETTPRPVAPDTPIVLGPRGPATAGRAPRAAAPAEVGGEVVIEPAPSRPTAAAPAAAVPAASVATAARPPAALVAPAVPAPTAAPGKSAEPATAQAPRKASAPAASPERVAAPAPPHPGARPSEDGARARALLDGPAALPAASASAPLSAGRFVVQVGAFSDPATLREARARVEKLGLKTYTQVIDGEGGQRTRVRVGPFASRDEALAAAGKLKGAGLPASVLAL